MLAQHSFTASPRSTERPSASHRASTVSTSTPWARVPARWSTSSSSSMRSWRNITWQWAGYIAPVATYA